MDSLIAWKNRDMGSTAVMLDGARRVGKSYIVKQFAEQQYKSYIIIDFNIADDAIKELFLHSLNDLDNFFLFLSTYYQTKLYERESLIIFDEVQLFPRARSAIKYLVADGRYDYVETGSLMSIKKNVQDILIPSEEYHLQMYPMDFEEFLWAMGNDVLMPFIKNCFEKRKAVGAALHRQIMTYFRKYLIVGGMPQAVLKFVATENFEETDRIKRNIINLYRNDIIKHAAGYERKVESIFDEIPGQLQKHEKKFKLASVEKGARFRDYEDALFWLDDAMITNPCYNADEPNIGLKMSSSKNTLKCYMADTGLLISHCFDENGIVSEQLYKKLLFDKLEVNEGMFMENIVAQMLRAAGHKLYFYSVSSRTAENRMEIDFLIAKKDVTSRHNISPIEVKSGQRYTMNSLRKFLMKYKEYLAEAYVVHTQDLKQEDGITFIPVYMVPLL